MANLTDIVGVGPSRQDTLTEAGYDSVEAVASVEPETLAKDTDLNDDKALDFVVQARNIVDAQSSEPTEATTHTVTEEVAEAQENMAEDNQTNDDSDVEAQDVDTNQEEYARVDERDEGGSQADVDQESLNDETLRANAQDGVENSEQDVHADEVAQDESDVRSQDEAQADAQDTQDEEYSVTLNFENARQYDAFYNSLLTGYQDHYRSNQPSADAMDKAMDATRGTGEGEVTLDLTGSELNRVHSAITQQRLNYQSRNVIELMDELDAVKEQINAARKEHLF